MPPQVRLRLVQVRPGMLYAHRLDGWHTIPTLIAGFAIWLWGISSAVAGEAIVWGVLGVILSLVFFASVPWWLSQGRHLLIDCKRGWLHWQRHRLRRIDRENFSPQRLEKLSIQPRHLMGMPCGYRVILHLDHPRLATVQIAAGWRYERLAGIAREVAEALQIHWQDEQGLLHVPIPNRPDAALSWHGFEWWSQLPPPPEIEVLGKGEEARLLLPHRIGYHSERWIFLFYAVIWCLWAWSSLYIEARAFGPVADWNAVQTWTEAILFGASLAGCVMLVRGILQVLSRELLMPGEGCWIHGRQWLGLSWGKRPLQIDPRSWLRRVDPPGAESGLWVPLGRRERRIGAGLSAEGLAWLQRLLRRN